MKLFQNLRNDVPAGIVVFFVAVPLCLGIALASGAPLFSGLIAGMVGGIIVGSLSGSALGVSGPAAGLAVIVLHAIGELGFEPFLLAVVLSGAMQVALGLLKAGVLSYFFPSSVIRGMLSGIGLIILLKQIPHAFGYDKDPEGDVQFVQPDGETTFSELGRMLDSIDYSATFVAMTSLAILLLWDNVLAKRGRIFQLIQGPLVVVVFGICFQALAEALAPTIALAPTHLVTVPVANSFDEFLGLFRTPDWSAISNTAIWITAATIAVVGSLETLLCLEATDKLDPQKRITPANRELVAQGVGNMVSGAIGGLPITQVIVRSSANILSGARSKLSGIVHGVMLVLAVFTLPTVLNMVPLAVLASILLVVGYKLAKPALFVEMYRRGWEQFVPFLVTIVGIVFTDLLRGIAAGMVVAVFIILRRNFLNSHFLHREDGEHGARHTVHMRLSEDVTFLNRGAILREFARIPDNTDVVIDMRQCANVDYDVIEAIEDFRQGAAERGIKVETIESAAATPPRARELESTTN